MLNIKFLDLNISRDKYHKIWMLDKHKKYF